jgi:plasmid stability protein
MIDPNRPGHYPICPFYAITGYYCPGCGSLRMVHALTHGHVAEAFGRNALTLMTLPFLAYLWVRWALAARQGRPLQAKILRPWPIVAFAVVSVVFWVVRNLPAGHALAP